jgi:hypothetical protein
MIARSYVKDLQRRAVLHLFVDQKFVAVEAEVAAPQGNICLGHEYVLGCAFALML